MATEYISLATLVDDVKLQTADYPKMVLGYRSGTLESLYDVILTKAVHDILLIPTRRFLNDLSSYADEDVMDSAEALALVIEAVNPLTTKTVENIQADVLALVKNFPIDDVREAATLKKQGRVN